MSLTYFLRGLLLFERGDEDQVGGPLGQVEEEKEERKPPTRRYGSSRGTAARNELRAQDAGRKVDSYGATRYDNPVEAAEELQKTIDPTAEQLLKSGWNQLRPTAIELESCDADEPIHAGMKKDLWSSCCSLVGPDTVKEAWKFLNLPPMTQGMKITGVQARRLALACADLQHEG